MTDAAVICEELKAIIERHMMDVSYVEALTNETGMVVHLLSGTEVYIDVQMSDE